MTAPSPEPKTLAQAKRQIARLRDQLDATKEQVLRIRQHDMDLICEVADLRERNRQAAEILAGRD